MAAMLPSINQAKPPSAIYNFSARAMLTPRPSPQWSSGVDRSALFQPHLAYGRPSTDMYSPGTYAGVYPASAASFPSQFRSPRTKPLSKPRFYGVEAGIAPRQRYYANGVTGFFPPVKLRASAIEIPVNAIRSKSYIKFRNNVASRRTPPFLLELAPEPPQNTPDPTAPTRVNSGRSSMSKASSARSARSAASQTDQPPVYPYINRSDTCDDLSFLPRPKMIVSRDNPWVFRYKVKKNMNELSKIMASRPPPPPAPSLAE